LKFLHLQEVIVGGFWDFFGIFGIFLGFFMDWQSRKSAVSPLGKTNKILHFIRKKPIFQAEDDGNH
jgi:hypothetical protein